MQRRLAGTNNEEEEEDGEQAVMHIMAPKLPWIEISTELHSQETDVASDELSDATYVDA